MIIDCHGHYTTAPKALEDWRNRQIAGIKDASVKPKPLEVQIGDDELRESIAEGKIPSHPSDLSPPKNPAGVKASHADRSKR